MARIRTIKPEFFTSEDIVSLSPMARLLYIALWCEADREGRMLWKPRTFKMRYFPADDCDVIALCKELTDAGLVRLYGDGLAHVPSFSKHQHLNPREAVSQLAEPDAPVTRGRRVSTRHSPDSDAQVGREGKGREGKAYVEANASTSPPGALPDDSGAEDLPQDPKGYTIPDCPVAEVVELYHQRCPTLNRVEVVNEFRRGLVRSRWREVCAEERMDRTTALAWWGDYFAHVNRSAFLIGKTPGKPGSPPFKADFEWLVRPQNFVRVVELRYHREAA